MGCFPSSIDDNERILLMTEIDIDDFLNFYYKKVLLGVELSSKTDDREKREIIITETKQNIIKMKQILSNSKEKITVWENIIASLEKMISAYEIQN